VLRPGGILLVGTGNAASWTVRAIGRRWDYFSIDGHGGHISFFNPGSMMTAAQRAGLKVEKIETRNVNLQDACTRGGAGYRLLKLAAQALNAPARVLGQGHDMLAFLRKAC